MASPKEPDSIALALVRYLIRAHGPDMIDAEALAATLEEMGAPDEAHLVRCELIQAMAPSQSDWDAERRRARFEIVPDGGNGAT